jgi:hypothetical protein
MTEIKIAEGTLQFSIENNPDKLMVSSSFEYVQGSLNSPYIVASSNDSSPNEAARDIPPSARVRPNRYAAT